MRFMRLMLSRDLASRTSDDELFEMANLYPDTTGLPMTIWVSPRGHAQHDVRIKVNMTPGDHMTIDSTAVVAVRPAPPVIAGRLSSADERAVFRWIALNEAALVAYREGTLDTPRMIHALQPLSSAT